MDDEIRYRQQRDEDAEGVARVTTLSYPRQPPLDAETVRWAIGRVDAARPAAFIVAERADEIVGSAFLRGMPIFPGLRLSLEVHPAHRRRGIGTRLLEEVVRAAGEPRFEITAGVQESDTGSLAFATRHGFTERDRMFESVLELETFDDLAFASALAAAADRGIRFAALSEVDTPELRRRLYATCNQLQQEVPSTDPVEPVSYEQWASDWLEAPLSRADLLVIGFDGDDPVAVSSIIVAVDGTGMNHFSGVLASHRGYGLGLAMKVEALRRAKATGITRVLTDNHTRNAPMLAINQRLGYQRMSGWIELTRSPA